MQKFIKILPDALVVSGVATIAYGAWLIHPAAGFVVGGLLLLGMGIASSKAGVKAAE